jgi:hypothetical protein
MPNHHRREWEKTVLLLTLNERREFKRRMQWKLFLYQVRAGLRAFEALPVFTGLTLQAGLYTFLILNQLPRHPLSIPTAFGGGLSMALTTHYITKIISKFTSI